MNGGQRARLSTRLEAILEELASGLKAGQRAHGLLADLCADHAQLALAAVERGLALRAVAIELRAAPLVDARARLRKSKLGGRVLLVRGSDLSFLRRIDALVIAGVGGDLAAQLLERSVDAAGASLMVVQPNRHAREVRVWARRAGFHLRHERVAAEQRRLHLVLRFERAGGPDPAYGAHPLEAELQLGPRLLASAEPAARAFLQREKLRMQALAGRRPELESARALLERKFRRP